MFRSYCVPTKTSVDVGANQGDMTLFLRRYSTEVHSFEPVPEMVESLRHRFRNCNVTVHDCAVGAGPGSGTLRIPTFGAGLYTTRSSMLEDLDSIRVNGAVLTKSREVTVRIAALDDFELGQVGFIKIDVEGYELDVLAGAAKTIRKNMPVIYIEIEQRRHPNRPIEEIFRIILNHGYSGWFFRSSQLVPIAEFNAETMQAPQLEDSSQFVNNFIFKPNGLAHSR
jgi:FkbM family methyltransferase